MSTDLTPFIFEAKQVRVVQDDQGNPWFVAADVCRALEMADVTSALRALDDDEKGPLTVRTLGGEQSLNGISEPGLYKLMARSRKPEAKRFDRWVRHEVLPAIRKTGGYIQAAPDETPEQLYLRAMTALHATVERQQMQLAEALPKADGYDLIADAEGSLCITDAAKALQISPKALFDFMDRNRWTYRRPGADHRCAYQSRIEAADLIHKVSTILRPDGSERICEQVRVTPRGLAKLTSLIGKKATLLVNKAA